MNLRQIHGITYDRLATQLVTGERGDKKRYTHIDFLKNPDIQTAESAEERGGACMVRHSANLCVLRGLITKTKELNIHIDSLKNLNRRERRGTQRAEKVLHALRTSASSAVQQR